MLTSFVSLVLAVFPLYSVFHAVSVSDQKILAEKQEFVQKQKEQKTYAEIPREVFQRQEGLTAMYLQGNPFSLNSDHTGVKSFVLTVMSYVSVIHEQQKKILENQEQLLRQQDRILLLLLAK